MEIFEQFSYGKRYWLYLTSMFAALIIFTVFLLILPEEHPIMSGVVIIFLFTVVYSTIKAGKNLYFWHKNQPMWLVIILIGFTILVLGGLPLLGYIIGWLQKTPNKDEFYGYPKDFKKELKKKEKQKKESLTDFSTIDWDKD
ncbi:MAG TPA: hypothetical protein ENH90_01760 [bacterium]|nr:hypothetical protein [bacterium]